LTQPRENHWFVVGVVVVALAASVAGLPRIVRATHARLVNHPRSVGAKESVAAAGLQIPDAVLTVTRARIPPHAVYGVVVGKGSPTPDYLLVGIPQFLQYWLLPRRYTPNASGAQWVVLYGDSGTSPARHVIASFRMGPRLTLVRTSS
jgi:hypothetical protein